MKKLVLALFMVAAGCRHSDVAKAPLGPIADQIIDGFRLTETDGGKTLYDLNADKAWVYGDSNRIEVSAPSIRFFDPAGNVTSTLTADAGTVYNKTSDLVARNHVHVATRDSTTLDTDSLAWLNAQQLIETDAPVSMRNAQGVINGIGLVSDAGLRRIEVKKTIQATTNMQFQNGLTDSGLGGDSAGKSGSMASQ